MKKPDIHIKSKLCRLKKILESMGSVLVAYSGGVDSTFLLKQAKDILGKNVLAVTAKSETYTESEYSQAVKIAKKFGVRHKVISTGEFRNPEFISNPPDRCYHCKKELFRLLSAIAEKEGCKYIIDGTNYGDRADYRPGMRAKKEFSVRSPLDEAGFTKEDIRSVSRRMGLPTWNKPACACLASRIPYGEQITLHKLAMVNKAEECLKSLGFTGVRVRHHGSAARIEVPSSQIGKLMNEKTRRTVTQGLKKAGYNYVTLDLEGYRTGSLNELLKGNRKV